MASTAVCPWCREPVPVARRDDDDCPRCGRPRARDGRALRPVDVGFDLLRSRQHGRLRRVLATGVPLYAAAFLLGPLLHGGLPPVLLVPAAIAGNLLAVRLGLLRHLRPTLGLRRRFIVGWFGRLGVIAGGLWGYGMSVTPILGAVVAPATFAGLTAAVHAYAVWSLSQERDDAPPATWEKLAIAVLVLAAAGALAAVAALAGLVGWLAQELTTPWP